MTKQLLHDLIELNKKHNDAGVSDLIADLRYELQVEYELNLVSGHEPLTGNEYSTLWNKTETGVQ